MRIGNHHFTEIRAAQADPTVPSRVRVKAAKVSGDEVHTIFIEYNAAHQGGKLTIADDGQIHECGRTDRVQNAIKTGLLIEV